VKYEYYAMVIELDFRVAFRRGYIVQSYKPAVCWVIFFLLGVYATKIDVVRFQKIVECSVENCKTGG
jgi:hypothetical protein